MLHCERLQNNTYKLMPWRNAFNALSVQPHVITQVQHNFTPSLQRNAQLKPLSLGENRPKEETNYNTGTWFDLKEKLHILTISKYRKKFAILEMYKLLLKGLSQISLHVVIENDLTSGQFENTPVD